MLGARRGSDTLQARWRVSQLLAARDSSLGANLFSDIIASTSCCCFYAFLCSASVSTVTVS